MDKVLTGNAYKSEEYLIDFGGDPVEDAVWTEYSFDAPGTPPAWTVDDLGAGFYLFSFTPQDPGYYDLIVHTMIEGQRLVYHIECLAEGAVYYTTPNRTSLGELRRVVARQIRDYRRVTASAGSLTVISDPFTLSDNTDHFRGAELICITGHEENVGQKRKVVSSSYEQHAITFIPPLPQPVQPGDTFDMFNFNRVRATIAEYDDAINDAIRMAHPQNREDMYFDVHDGLDESAGGIHIPEPFVAIYGLSFRADNGSWYVYDQVDGWTVDPVRRLIVPKPGSDPRSKVYDRPVRIFGYGRARSLVDDNDTTHTDVEWIVDSAVSAITTGSMDQATFPIGQSRANRADQLRGKMAVNIHPGTISLE